MADVGIDPFGEHKSRPEEPMGGNIPLIPGKGGLTWDLQHKQETSFRGKVMKVKFLKKKKLKNCTN